MSQEGSPECLLITMSFNLNSISQTSVCLSVLMNLLENSFKNADSGAEDLGMGPKVPRAHHEKQGLEC